MIGVWCEPTLSSPPYLCVREGLYCAGMHPPHELQEARPILDVCTQRQHVDKVAHNALQLLHVAVGVRHAHLQ